MGASKSLGIHPPREVVVPVETLSTEGSIMFDMCTVQYCTCNVCLCSEFTSHTVTERAYMNACKLADMHACLSSFTVLCLTLVGGGGGTINRVGPFRGTSHD